MRKPFFIIATFSALLIALSSTFSSAYAHSENQLTDDTISVSGTGFIDAEPDVVDININLNATKKTLKAAKADVDDRYREVLKAIDNYSINKKDIKLTRLNSHQDYEWVNNKRILKGFRLNRTLKITVRDTDKFPDIQQSLINAGITNINHVSPRFGDDTLIREMALKEAAKAAKRKAQSLADQFGRQLGAVASISEGNVRMPTPRPYMKQARSMAMADAMVESAPAEMLGTQKVTATISVVFRLK